MQMSTENIYRFFRYVPFLILASGFGLAKIWWGVAVILVMIPFWLYTQHLQGKIYSLVKLMLFVGIAVGGLLNNASSYLMVAGVSTALASWELEDKIPKSMKSSVPSMTSSYKKKYLNILSITIATGLLIAEVGLFLKLVLPFGLVFLVAILVVFFIFQLFLLLTRIEKS